MPVISVPRTLRQQLGDQAADELIDLLNRATEETKRDVLVLAEERYERRLSEEIAKVNQHTTDVKGDLSQQTADVRSDLSQQTADVRSDLSQQIADVRSDLSQQIADVEVRLSERISELKVEMASTGAELTRWMFVFWVGQLAVILGVLFAFFR
ncbi:MAG: LA_3696 family protein [Anaerolineae bacterium]